MAATTDNTKDTYSIDIPANPPLANETARINAADALTIEQGSIRAIGDLTNAMRETKRRRLLKEIRPPDLTSVSSDEVAQSFLRQHVVATQVAAKTYPRADPTAFQEEVLRRFDQFNERFDEVNGRIDALGNQLNGRIDGLSNRVDDLTRSVDALSARSDNLEARRFNSKKTGEDASIRPLVKVHADYGNLPVPANLQIDPLPDDPPRIGTLYPDFPTTRNGIFAMTHAHIAYMANWANESFGIVAGDDINARRRKFWDFIHD